MDEVQVGDVFEPKGGSPAEAIEVYHVRPDGMAECKVIKSGVTFTAMSHMLLDPLRWVRAGYMGSRVPPIPPQTPPAPNALDQAEWAALTPARRLGDRLRSVADLIDERETKYGPAVETWERIGAAAGVSAETALRVLLAMKDERARHSPENPDHLVDKIGYLAILAEVQAAHGDRGTSPAAAGKIAP